MKKIVNVAVVGLGQVGNYLNNELIKKKRILNLKQVKELT